MKRVLFLDACENIVPSILLAKELGYYTITCDNKRSNIGHSYSDKQYYISTYDLTPLKEMIIDEGVDGVVSLASSHSLYATFHLSKERDLNLNLMPFRIVDLMLNKDKLRGFLRDNGLPCPSFVVIENEAQLEDLNLSYPVIVKPVDLDGNRGITKVVDPSMLIGAVSFALAQSAVKRVVIEQFIESSLQLNGDCIVVNGQVQVAYLGRYVYNDDASIIPYSTMFSPAILKDDIREKATELIQKVVDASGLKSGVINVEMRVEIDTKQIYIIEINPRHSGNRIFHLMDDALGISTAQCAISLALGQTIKGLDNLRSTSHNASCILYSRKDGVLDELIISDELKRHIIYSRFYVGEGERVTPFQCNKDKLALLSLSFDTYEEMVSVINNIEDYYTVKLV